MALMRQDPRDEPGPVTAEDVLQLNGRIWALMRTLQVMLEESPDPAFKQRVRARLKADLGGHLSWEHFHGVELYGIEDTLHAVAWPEEKQVFSPAARKPERQPYIPDAEG